MALQSTLAPQVAALGVLLVLLLRAGDSTSRGAATVVTAHPPHPPHPGTPAVRGEAGGPTVNTTCDNALQQECGAKCPRSGLVCTFTCTACAGDHQQTLQHAGCANGAIAAWCAVSAPSVN